MLFWPAIFIFLFYPELYLTPFLYDVTAKSDKAGLGLERLFTNNTQERHFTGETNDFYPYSLESFPLEAHIQDNQGEPTQAM